VAIDWREPTNTGSESIFDFIIEWRVGAAGSWQTFNDGVSLSTDDIVTGLQTGSEHSFRVAAVSAAGTSDWSNVLTATPVAFDPYNLDDGSVNNGHSHAFYWYEAPGTPDDAHFELGVIDSLGGTIQVVNLSIMVGGDNEWLNPLLTADKDQYGSGTWFTCGASYDFFVRVARGPQSTSWISIADLIYFFGC
jgi:hypothetical protein